MFHKNKQYLFAFGGNILEFYDVTLYGFLLAKLQSIFFPPATDQVSCINYLAFGAAYVTRPLGGLIIGYVADRFSRELALVLSIVVAAIPTVLVGLLPSYESWGYAATIILLLCRLLQGLCVGGEYAAASTYIFEHTSSKSINFVNGLFNASNFLGAVIATLVGLLVTQSFMPDWAWRVAFISGGVLTLGIFLMRRKLLQNMPSHLTSPQARGSYWRFIVENQKKVAQTLLMGGLSSAPYMLFTIFLTNYVGKKFGMQLHEQIWINLLLCSSYLFVYPLCGRLSDKYGNITMMRWGALSLAICGPIAFLCVDILPLNIIVFLQLLINILGMGFSSGVNAFVGHLYPRSVRCRGMVSLTLGGAFLASLAPAMAHHSLTWGVGLAPAAIYFFSLSILCFMFASHSRKRSSVVQTT